MSDVPTFDIEDARAYITKVRWQFAKTMPQWPHEYTIRDWRPELASEFEAFATFIRETASSSPGRAPRPIPSTTIPISQSVISSTGLWVIPFPRRP